MDKEKAKKEVTVEKPGKKWLKIIVTLVSIIILLSFAYGNSEKILSYFTEETEKQFISCEQLGKSYNTVPELTGTYLLQGKFVVLNINPEKFSREIKIPGTGYIYYPNATVDIRLPDGQVITRKPSDGYPDLRGYNTFRFKGKSCILLSKIKLH
ncbi:MAG: hypothetical protein WDZ80_04660 [Candidatus Paceibacterota bacterium]